MTTEGEIKIQKTETWTVKYKRKTTDNNTVTKITVTSKYYDNVRISNTQILC